MSGREPQFDAVKLNQIDSLGVFHLPLILSLSGGKELFAATNFRNFFGGVL